MFTLLRGKQDDARRLQVRCLAPRGAVHHACLAADVHLLHGGPRVHQGAGLRGCHMRITSLTRTRRPRWTARRRRWESPTLRRTSWATWSTWNCRRWTRSSTAGAHGAAPSRPLSHLGRHARGAGPCRDPFCDRCFAPARVVAAGARSDVVGTVESVKAASDVYTPVSGTVTEVNDELVDNPALVNESPMDRAWFVRVKVGPDRGRTDSGAQLLTLGPTARAPPGCARVRRPSSPTPASWAT